MTANKPVKKSPRRGRGRPTLGQAADIDKRILDIALQEFLEHGYGGASMSRMVRNAGISKTTLYSRFSSKEAMFRAIIDRQIEKLSPGELLISREGPLGLEEGLRRYAYHMVDVSLTGELLGVNRLMDSESHRFPELGKAAAMRTSLGIDRIAGFIADCAARGGYRCRDPRAVAEVFILAIRGWYIDVMLTHRKVTPKQRHACIDKTIHVLISSFEHW
jgi:AcrR family transcriptional regulator